jgi:hypothetical protein
MTGDVTPFEPARPNGSRDKAVHNLVYSATMHIKVPSAPIDCEAAPYTRLSFHLQLIIIQRAQRSLLTSQRMKCWSSGMPLSNLFTSLSLLILLQPKKPVGGNLTLAVSSSTLPTLSPGCYLSLFMFIITLTSPGMVLLSANGFGTKTLPTNPHSQSTQT